MADRRIHISGGLNVTLRSGVVAWDLIELTRAEVIERVEAERFVVRMEYADRERALNDALRRLREDAERDATRPAPNQEPAR